MDTETRNKLIEVLKYSPRTLFSAYMKENPMASLSEDRIIGFGEGCAMMEDLVCKTLGIDPDKELIPEDYEQVKEMAEEILSRRTDLAKKMSTFGDKQTGIC